MMKFWNDLNECVKSFEKGRKVIDMSDMNLKVDDESVYDTGREPIREGTGANGLCSCPVGG